MDPPLRVLLLSLEFLSPFSGNGQYSRCIVRGLKRAGCQVLVVSGRPESNPLSSQDPEAQGHTQPPHGVIDIGLPKWGTLDRGSSWEEFAGGCCSPPHLARMAGFQPQVVVCVDYHATHAWQGIKPLLLPLLLPTPLPPMVYMNFRLFCTSVGLHAVGGSDGAFYRGAERRAVREAALTIALCRQDALLLQALALGVDPLTGLVDEEDGAASATTAAAPVRMSTLLPPLRSDVATLVMQRQSTTATSGGGGVGGAPPTSFPSTSLHPGYSFLTSLVRLSPEKNAAAIPALLAALEEVSPGILSTLTRLQPFFAGAGDTSPYATAFKAALQPLHQQHQQHQEHQPQPLTLCTTFMGPLELGHVLASSALNIHPCTADAYGMTIVEAAAWGVPSLVHVPPFPRRSQGGGDSKGDASNAPLLPPPNSLFSTDGAIAQATERLKQSFQPPSTTATATTTTGLFTPPPPTACSRVDLSPLLALFSTTTNTTTTAPSPPLGAQVVSLASLLPPVGACDLLAPSPHDPSTLPSIIPFDFTAPPVHQAKALIPILHAAVAVTREEGGSVPPAASAAAAAQAEFARVKHSAKTCALAWSEEGHGETLRALLLGVVAANKAK